MADSRLTDIAQTILDALISELEMAGITVPSRRYIHSGEVAHDFSSENCGEAFIVAWGGSSQGTVVEGQAAGILSQVIKCATPMSARFVIVLLRCVPTIDDDGNPPSATSLQESGEQVLADAMTLPAVAIDAHLRNELTGIGCSLAGISQVAPIGPFGAVGGTAMELFVGLV